MPQRLLVKKFGGTSMGSIEKIEAVADRLQRERNNGTQSIVVVSAMAGETNRLVSLAQAIDPASRGPAYDMLVASGEQVSVALLAIALQKRGIPARPLLAYQLGIMTDSVYSKARIQEIRTDDLHRSVAAGEIPVIAGFQGVDEEGNITKLGRGGSDTTAVAVAAALANSDCEIYTDVPAIFTADPRLVPRAREIARLSFDEMMEMAALGSKVLHIRSVEIAAKYGVRIHLRSTFEERDGSWIVPEGEGMENPVVSAVTHDPNTVIFELNPVPLGPVFLADLFRRLSDRGVVVDIITQSEAPGGQRLAFSVTQEDLPLAQGVLQQVLHNLSCEVSMRENMAKISVVGVGMRNHPGVAAKFFEVLARENLTVHLVTTSEIKISAVIAKSGLASAAQALHTAFGLDR
jgi:aspartate kinase